MRKVLNVFIILILFSFMFIPLTCFAEDDATQGSIPQKSQGIDLDRVMDPSTYQQGNAEIDAGLAKTEKFSTRLISNFFVIYKVAGVGIAIIILMVMGAKFMWGSVEQKAEVKKHLIVYVTGAVVFFASAFIVGILQDFIIANLK